MPAQRTHALRATWVWKLGPWNSQGNPISLKAALNECILTVALRPLHFDLWARGLEPRALRALPCSRATLHVQRHASEPCPTPHACKSHTKDVCLKMFIIKKRAAGNPKTVS